MRRAILLFHALLVSNSAEAHPDFSSPESSHVWLVSAMATMAITLVIWLISRR